MKFLSAVLCMLLAFSASAQRNIFDGFDDNSNEWPVSVDRGSSMIVEKGEYVVHNTAEGYWSATKTVSKGMNDHFRIELSVARDSMTSIDKGVGIMWGNKGDSVRMAFLIYGDGHFVFQQIRDGKTQFVSPKDIRFAIDAEGYNNLRVERNMATNMYDFSINDQLVLSSPFVAPASDEVGLYAEMAGLFRFDNFWFIEKANTNDSYRPHALTMADRCSEEELHYQGDYDYSFCVPFGWRVDEYMNTHCVVWPVGASYQVSVDFAKLAIEDSFGVAAKNDFKVYVDSAQYADEKQIYPLGKDSVSPGVECWSGMFIYTDINDKNSYTVTRFYVYNESVGGFLLVETKIPTGEENKNLEFQRVAMRIAQTLRWD